MTKRLMRGQYRGRPNAVIRRAEPVWSLASAGRAQHRRVRWMGTLLIHPKKAGHNTRQ
jgi:hypothetical protein